MKRLMKHVKVLSSEKPMQAQETSWVEWKQIWGPLKLSGAQTQWLAAVMDNALQK